MTDPFFRINDQIEWYQFRFKYRPSNIKIDLVACYGRYIRLAHISINKKCVVLADIKYDYRKKKIIKIRVGEKLEFMTKTMG